MYITLGIIVLIIGLLLVLLPNNSIRHLIDSKKFLICLRFLGIVMICIGIYVIYLVAVGEVTLPLNK